MAKPKSGSASSRAKTVEKISYKNAKIEIVEKEGALELRVNGKSIWTGRDPDTGDYFSPELPYQVFSSQIELGKAVVDKH